MLCWNCGHIRMDDAPELGRGWFKCSDCGATYIEPLKPGQRPISIERDGVTGGTKYKARSRRQSKKVRK